MRMISLLHLNLLHTQQGRRVGSHDDDEDEGADGDVRSGMSLESVQYFPHNDSAQIRFSCPPPPPPPAPEGGGAVPSKDALPHSRSRTRTVTCSFAEEQAKKVRFTHIIETWDWDWIGPFSRMAALTPRIIAKYVLRVIISAVRNGQTMQNMRALSLSWKFAYLSAGAPKSQPWLRPRGRAR